jgi:hypothetical protein
MDSSPKHPKFLGYVAIIETQPLLPRSAWSSQTAFLRAVFKAKKALDRLEH